MKIDCFPFRWSQVIGAVSVLLAGAVCSFARVVPMEGLLLHLDGSNVFNTSSVWYDSSGNNRHATNFGAGFTPLEGYHFNGTNYLKLGGVSPHAGADRFAYAVRLSSATNTSQRYFLGTEGALWNSLYYDYANNAVTWDVYNDTVAAGDNYFRGVHSGSTVQPSLLGSAEHLIGITWEGLVPGTNRGTARIYLNGVFSGQVTNALKPGTAFPNHTDIRLVGADGHAGAPDWVGQITEVVVYSNYIYPSDYLMQNVFLSIPEPATAFLLTAAAGLLWRRRR